MGVVLFEKGKFVVRQDDGTLAPPSTRPGTGVSRSKKSKSTKGKQRGAKERNPLCEKPIETNRVNCGARTSPKASHKAAHQAKNQDVEQKDVVPKNSHHVTQLVPVAGWELEQLPGTVTPPERIQSPEIPLSAAMIQVTSTPKTHRKRPVRCSIASYHSELASSFQHKTKRRKVGFMVRQTRNNTKLYENYLTAKKENPTTKMKCKDLTINQKINEGDLLRLNKD